MSSSVVSGGDILDRALAIARDAGDRERGLLCVIGPTASGKSDLALAIAERVGGEIVSSDSVQVYRYFDIGSGKPTLEEVARVPHHFIDALEPDETIDAAEWAKRAEVVIEDVRARGRVPIVCGGTFFWVRALVLGLVKAPAANAEIRARHRALVAELGATALHAELLRLDPVSAGRLHPNDVLRVSRALEVQELSGRPMSEWQAEHGFKERRFEATFLGLAHEPQELTERIAARVSRMIERGFIDETRDLLARGFGTSRAMGSVGYAEVRAHLEGVLPREELDAAIVRSTRVFARRQRTWLKNVDVSWLR